MISHVFSSSVYAALLPRTRVRTVDWAPDHVPAPPPVEGNIDWSLFPYMVEPVDCLDSPDYDQVTLQFGSRLGKTTGVQCWMLNQCLHNPHNGVWAEPDEPSLRRVLKRTWTMVDGTAGLKDKAAPLRRRSNKELLFEDCLIHGAYSGSVSTAADFAAFFVAINEVDKYSHRRRLDADGEDAGEADFPELVMERAKGCAGATIGVMSTPSVKGRSRIEAYRLAGDRRRFYVPCPFCGHRQILKTGRSENEPGGIKYSKGKDGRSDPDRAFETAYYECEACRGKIRDEHRHEMINAGVWVKEGQSIDADGRIHGTPLRSGRHASFGPLGTHYSLLPKITWGTIARKWVESKGNRTKFRNFVNSWEGETFDPTPPKFALHEVAGRLACDLPRGEIPDDACFLTLGVDTGSSGTDLIFYWMVCAWRNDETGHVVDWGEAVGESELWAQAGGYRAEIEGFDSGGNRGGDDTDRTVTDRVYALCRRRRQAWPIKGSSNTVDNRMTDWYADGYQQVGFTRQQIASKKKRKLSDLLVLNSHRSQDWRVSLVSGITKPGDDGFVSLPADVLQEPELYEPFLDELTSDMLVDGRWIKRPGVPNEFGDTLRICKIIAEKHARGRWGKLEVRGAPGKPAASNPVEPLVTPDGQPFFILDR